VADYRAGIQVIDIADPANPQRVGGFETGGIVRNVVVQGHYALVADDVKGVIALDISLPASPQFVAAYETAGVAVGVAVQSNRIAVADGDWGLEILELRLGGAVAPKITTQPKPQIIGYGSAASFAVTATGTEPLAYQWKKEGIALSDGGRFAGANTPDLRITAAQVADLGDYSCVVSNAGGSTLSEPAALNLLPTFLLNSAKPFTTGGAFEFELVAEPNKHIRVEYSDDLQTWVELTSFDSTGDPLMVRDPGAASHTSRFYRAASP